MNVRDLILDTSVSKNALDILADINQNATTSTTSIPRSRLLLVTLTTTIMMANDIPLAKEYYQYTRAYLETIKNDDGTSLPNISAFLKYINEFEDNHKIDDDMQATQIEIPSEELIEVPVVMVEETFNEDELINQTKEPLSSTKKENNDEDAEKTITNDLSDAEKDKTTEEAADNPPN